MGLKSSMVKLVPFGAMVVVECLDVGLTTLSKAAMSRGMNPFVFVVYSNALASLILLPTSLIFQRQSRPPLTLTLLCKFFLLSLVGITVMQNCVFTAINYSSPTLTSAISNLSPAFTFLLAFLFRDAEMAQNIFDQSIAVDVVICSSMISGMEKVDLRSSRSQLKILGTLVSISGALIITLYKGPSIIIRESPASVSFTNELFSQPSSSNMLADSNNWAIGALFGAIATFSISVWTTSQAAILKGYPSEITIVSFYCFFGAIQCAVVALFAERDPNAWKLSPNIELIAIFYSAVCGSVVTPWSQTWCIGKKGPVFVAMFKPLGIAIAALMGIIFLGDTLHVGCVIGAVVIAAGFYGVIWAQTKEEEKGEKHESIRVPSSSKRAPLLHSQREA